MTIIKPEILAVDDESDMLDAFQAILSRDYQLFTAKSGASALDIIMKKQIQLVLLDIRMPKMNGVETLKKIKEFDQNIEVIMVTASKEIRSAVECMKLGANNYITKPFETEELRSIIKKALELINLKKENKCLRDIIIDSDRFCEIIGKSEKIKKIYEIIKDVAKVDSTILITGESGTGKELTAKAIHKKSKRSNKPFLTVNCAAIPDNLLESELFGFEAGTFTGAIERKLGKFELADGGTIFLDEIGCMSPGMQSKILRALEDKSIDRIGGRSPISVNIRIISATNLDFESAIKEGRFREDLFYRLNVIPINMPSLRERKDDIMLLAHHFLSRFNKELNKNITGFSDEAIAMLKSYSWPGNIRELQNLIERITALSKNSKITFNDLKIGENKNISFPENLNLEQAVIAFEREFIAQAIKQSGNNNSQAARLLGIHRTTLLSKIKALKVKQS